MGPDKNLPVLDKNPSVHLPVMDKSPSLDLPVMDKSPSSDLPGLDKSPSVLDKSLGYKPAIPLSQGQVFDFSVTHVEEGIIYGHLMDKGEYSILVATVHVHVHVHVYYVVTNYNVH